MTIRANGEIYFAQTELCSPDTMFYKFHEGFEDDLLALRLAFGQPMTLNSAARTEAYNNKIGGHPNSLHIYDKPRHGLTGAIAVDVHTPDPCYRTALAKLALSTWWSVGLISPTAIHLDMRAKYLELPQCIFPYPTK